LADGARVVVATLGALRAAGAVHFFDRSIVFVDSLRRRLVVTGEKQEEREGADKGQGAGDHAG
jgi:hypothetical protein